MKKAPTILVGASMAHTTLDACFSNLSQLNASVSQVRVSRELLVCDLYC
jgi:hypothetical protein